MQDERKDWPLQELEDTRGGVKKKRKNGTFQHGSHESSRSRGLVLR